MKTPPAVSANPRYDRFSIGLHWLMALALAGQLALGWWMLGLPKAPAGLRAEWFNVHKSIGVTLGLLLLLRLFWALRRPPCQPLAALGLPRWQSLLARANHAALYLCMIVLPLTGLLGSGFSPYPVRWFGLTLPRWSAPWPEAKTLCSQIHEAAVWSFMLLLLLHVGAALWHHFAKRDAVMARMGLRQTGLQSASSHPFNSQRTP